MSGCKNLADDDADLQLALKLSTELNDDALDHPAPDPDYDQEADFALAIQLQYGNEKRDGEIGCLSILGREHTQNTSVTPSLEQVAWGLREDDAKVAEYERETSNGKTSFSTFADFTACLKNFGCSRCREPHFQSALDVEELFQGWLTGETKLSSLVTCKRCQASSCIACVPKPFTKSSRLVRQGKQVSWCCAGGRLFLIWVLLCGFDQQYCATRTKSTTSMESSHHRSGKGTSSKRSRAGVGFGGSRRSLPSSMPSGMGYGGAALDADMDYFDHMEEFEHYKSLCGFKGKGHTLNPAHPSELAAKKVDNKTAAQHAQHTQDIFGTLILGFLRDLLPSLERETGFDVNPPEAATDMLVDSKILTYCAELLRNDSLDDATGRKDAYSTMLSFLQAIGGHTMAMRTLFGERPIRPGHVNVLSLTFNNSAEPPKETAASLAACLRNLSTQSGTILQNAKNNEKDFRTADGQNMLWLCRQILEFSNYIKAYVMDKPAEATKTWVEPIKGMPDQQVFSSHTYASRAKALKSAPPGRFKRLVTEITTLQTGLPPGIFVRYCESRLDVLKCVIIGPGGTPYENGIFEFDFFCTSEFPNKPPMVSFKGTGGGRISINPNLYADGKVCLSLLGTWSGEPWNPAQSTLLQIMVSLQAMILCEEPWYNEPGREMSYGGGAGQNPASTAYNHKLREQTVRYAMLTWLDQVPPLWKDVVDQQFKQNANKILEATRNWTKAKASHQPEYHGYEGYEDIFDGFLPGQPVADKSDLTSLLPRLQAALKKYGATVVVANIPKPVAKQPPAPPRYSATPPSFLEPFPTMTKSSSTSQPPFTPLASPPTHHEQPPWDLTELGNIPNGFGSFYGSGHVLGSNPVGQTPMPAASGGRGSPITGSAPERSYRYETRSSSYGQGGFNFNTPPNSFRGRGGPLVPPGLFGGSAFIGPGAAPSLRGGNDPEGRGALPSLPGGTAPRGRGDLASRREGNGVYGRGRGHRGRGTRGNGS